MIGYAKAGSIAIAQTDERSILRNPEHRKPQCLSSDSVMKAFKLTAAFAKTTAGVLGFEIQEILLFLFAGPKIYFVYCYVLVVRHPRN